jgi:BirA family biotin operon repressor/biotin-[acetyl-CoA-carboxylase] ligase
VKDDYGLVTTLALRLWAQRGHLLSWDHLGADGRGYDRTVSALSQLLEMGFDVRLSPAGVRIVPPEDTPCTHDIFDELGISSVCSPAVESTNDIAKSLAKVRGSHGTTVCAEAQIQGRGRAGHSWFSPAGLGIWFSMLLQPSTPLEYPGLVPLMMGLCVGRAIQHFGAVDIVLKWSNDLLWRRRKLAGILVERIVTKQTETFVVGVGMNVHHKEEDFPLELRTKSVALDTVVRKTMNRATVLAKLAEEILTTWKESEANGFREVPSAWERESKTTGMAVRAGTGQEILTGTIIGVNRGGALKLRLPDETERTLTSARIEIMWD